MCPSWRSWERLYPSRGIWTLNWISDRSFVHHFLSYRLKVWVVGHWRWLRRFELFKWVGLFLLSLHYFNLFLRTVILVSFRSVWVSCCSDLRLNGFSQILRLFILCFFQVHSKSVKLIFQENLKTKQLVSLVFVLFPLLRILNLHPLDFLD